MNPITSSDPNKYTCSSIISASCVLWNYTSPLTDCITTCAGDSLVDVIKATITKVCELNTIVVKDITTLSLASCVTVASPKTLSNVLIGLSNKICAIQTQVNNIIAGPGTTPICDPIFAFTTPACYATFLAPPIVIPSDPALVNQTIVQYVANSVCNLYTYMKAITDDLEDQIVTCCSSTPTPGTIPNVTSNCLFSGSIAINLAYGYLDAAFCAQKAIIGTNVNLSTSLNPTAPCTASINSYLGTTIGSATTVDQSFTNIYDAICKLTAKVSSLASIQATCCTFSCDSIDIAILGDVLDIDARTVDLVLTFNGSTSLPATYDPKVDTGSKVTFTDKNGSFITVAIDIFDSASYTGIDLTGLDFGGNIIMSANLNYQVSYGTDGTGAPVPYNCNKCLAGTIIVNTDCAVCTLTVSGGVNVNVKITYSIGGVTNVVVINSNGTFYVPKAATIDSIVDESGTSPLITTNCVNQPLPTPSTIHYWEFAIPNMFFINNAENDPGEFFITGIITNGNQYNVSSPGIIPTHLGAKAVDLCLSCPGYIGTAAYNNTTAGTSEPSSYTAYTAGTSLYQPVPTMAGYIPVLNAGISFSNPYVKEFTSSSTNECGTCMTYRYLYVATWSATAPLLVLQATGTGINTIVQLLGTTYSQGRRI
jgi:hypothetical protein